MQMMKNVTHCVRILNTIHIKIETYVDFFHVGTLLFFIHLISQLTVSSADRIPNWTFLTVRSGALESLVT